MRSKKRVYFLRFTRRAFPLHLRQETFPRRTFMMLLRILLLQLLQTKTPENMR